MHCNSKWKPHQDAVHWIHLARAQEKGLQFWQTKVSRHYCSRFTAGRRHRKNGIPERTTKLFFHASLRTLVCPQVTHSVVRCRKRIPRPHHCRGRFWVFFTVPTLVFILAWPFTQSTIVLQSPLISRVGHYQPPENQAQGEAGLLLSSTGWSR